MSNSNPYSLDFIGPPTRAQLIKRDVVILENWGDFLSAIGRPGLSQGEKLGLLHEMFNVELGHHRTYNLARRCYPPYLEEERLQFAFDMADGWADKSLLKTPRPVGEEPRFRTGRYAEWVNRGYTSESGEREIIARKAFDGLCKNFFAMQHWPKMSENGRKEEEEQWLNRFVSSRRFDLLRHFFRPEKDTYSGRIEVRNFLPGWRKQSHHEETAIAFICKLPKALWSWKPPEAPYTSAPRGETEVERTEREKKEAEKRVQVLIKMDERIMEGKVWIIEVLDRIEKLELLHDWLLVLERPCVEKLTDIALRTVMHDHVHPVMYSRAVRDLGEACLAGSSASWLLERRRLMRRVRAKLLKEMHAEQAEHGRKAREALRLRAVAEAEEIARAAQARLAELRGSA